MKLNFGKKLVLFLHWLLSIIGVALAACLCVWPDFIYGLFDSAYAAMGKRSVDGIGIALLAVYLLLSVLAVMFIFSGRRSRRDRGFITVDSSDSGKTRIAVGAVEQMIRQAVRMVDGITELKTNIINLDDAISIVANVTIASGAHIPTVTVNIQRAIRSYIELNCGVAVREVSVSVHAVDGMAKGAPAAPSPEVHTVSESKPAYAAPEMRFDPAPAEDTPVETAPETENTENTQEDNEA